MNAEKFSNISAICTENLPIEELCRLWKASVRATHHFLSKNDIAQLEPYVRTALAQTEELYIYQQQEKICAFIGIEKGKTEMLFVAPSFFGRGIGSELIQFAITQRGANSVDVNEQNPAALRFYQKHGFTIDSRSPTDDQGNPFPILHLKLLKTTD